MAARLTETVGRIPVAPLVRPRSRRPTLPLWSTGTSKISGRCPSGCLPAVSLSFFLERSDDYTLPILFTQRARIDARTHGAGHPFTLMLQEPKSNISVAGAPPSVAGGGMTNFPRHFGIAFLIIAALVISSPARSQVLEATLYGVVHDSTGGSLPGATVVVVQQGTNLTRETVADERGEFALPALPAGTYSLKIELTGFK